MSEKKDLTISLGEAPAEIKEKAHHFIDNYVASLKEHTEAYKRRMAEPKPQPQWGGRALVGGYQYWNCLLVGPIQFYGDPPYRPSKIIAHGEESLMLGVVWVNPAFSPGGGVSGTEFFAGRQCRLGFETINLSTVTNQPFEWKTVTFQSPAEVIHVYPWLRTWPDPGPQPQLYETYFTADLTSEGLSFAAFNTWHYDIDREPSFLAELPQLPDTNPGLPTHSDVPTTIWVPPRYPWVREGPAKFLVYHK